MSGGPLIEVLIAVTLLGGPLLAGVTLVQSSSRGVQAGLERGLAGTTLSDLAERLVERPAAALAELAATPKPERAAWLDARLAESTEGLPAEIAGTLSTRNASLSGRLDLDLSRVDGVPGLARLTLTAGLPDGTTLRVTRLWRSEAGQAAPGR